MAWYNETWTIPTSDLQEIYKTMNLPDESSTKIAECTFVMYIGAILEAHYANMIAFHFDTHAAFLTEELDLWYHGGLEDMGTNVAWKWAQLSKMFARPSEPTTNATKFEAPGCSVFGSSFLRRKLTTYSSLMGATSVETEDGHHTFNFNKTQMVENSKLLIAELFADLNLLPAISPARVEDDAPTVSSKPKTPDYSVNFTKQLSYFGKSIAIGDFNGDGIKEAFIGAPGYSRKAYG